MDGVGISDTAAGHSYIGDKNSYLSQLRQIEEQVRGVHRMVQNETYCIDVLAEVSAMAMALEAVSLGLLDDHLAHCVAGAAAASGLEAAELKVKEASDAIARLVRS
ncbi:metal-sensitive transcriptional regulator [Kribbella sancticallisti]|uniref:Metal-sensitive transcriptional regulator n=1 Tax=Kribbella sancticallisti TaxID=460087 RepID=A0ABN2DND3_9ACTN